MQEDVPCAEAADTRRATATKPSTVCSWLAIVREEYALAVTNYKDEPNFNLIYAGARSKVMLRRLVLVHACMHACCLTFEANFKIFFLKFTIFIPKASLHKELLY